MRHGTRFFYSNLNLSRMCMWEEVERNNREEDMKQALHERIALNKSLGQYWDNLRNENKRALVKSCLNAEDLQNFTRENTPVIEFLTKINPEVIWEYTFLAFELTYFQSGARFLEIAQSDTLNLKSEKFFSLLDGASESTWLLGGSPKVEHVLDHCMEVLKNAGDGDVIASSCLRIEQKLLEGYIQAEVDKDKTRNRRAQKKKERYAGPKNPRVQDISGLLNTNTVDNSTKGDAKIQDVVVNSDVGNLEVEAKVVGEARSTQIDELGSQTLDIVTGMARDYCATSSESLISEEARQGDGASMFEPLAQPDSGEEDEDQSAKDVSGSATARTTSQLQSSNAKSKKQEASGPSSPSPGVFSSVVSSNEPGGSSSNPSGEAAVPQTMAMEIRAVQDMMKKLMDMHEKLQEQMAVMKAIEADNVAMWVQRLEEFPKQVTGLIDDFVNKDFGVMLEKKVKNELADIKDAFVCANTPGIEQTQTVPWLYLITVRVKCEIKQLINWRIWSNQNLKLLSHSFELWLNKFLRMLSGLSWILQWHLPF
uniref:uncharacterized protein LOC101295505 n=1 Tax=Fragaria vesca subsp. vesca TaxID=101020 RepID=UPI0005CA2BC9|nr:PREDICTED: uncharacterized protein LOC101295505 [Fragaria vesca subsp. vesca]